MGVSLDEFRHAVSVKEDAIKHYHKVKKAWVDFNDKTKNGRISHETWEKIGLQKTSKGDRKKILTISADRMRTLKQELKEIKKNLEQRDEAENLERAEREENLKKEKEHLDKLKKEKEAEKKRKDE